jgi:hypothetical protein
VRDLSGAWIPTHPWWVRANGQEHTSGVKTPGRGRWIAGDKSPAYRSRWFMEVRGFPAIRGEAADGWGTRGVFLEVFLELYFYCALKGVNSMQNESGYFDF